jgi:ribosomal protein S18 acetylase RimI-like enzyme
MIIRHMQEQDLTQCAELHRFGYPKDLFTSRFSITMLERYFREILRLNPYCYVALNDEGQVVGFVMGGERTAEAVNSFMKQNLVPLTLTLARNPAFLVDKMVKVLRMTTKKGFKSKAKCRFLTKVVDPNLQRTGIATALMNKWESALVADGISLYGQSTRNDNERNISFLVNKMGCEIEYRDKTMVYFVKHLTTSEAA